LAYEYAVAKIDILSFNVSVQHFALAYEYAVAKIDILYSNVICRVVFAMAIQDLQRGVYRKV